MPLRIHIYIQFFTVKTHHKRRTGHRLCLGRYWERIVSASVGGNGLWTSFDNGNNLNLSLSCGEDGCYRGMIGMVPNSTVHYVVYSDYFFVKGLAKTTDGMKSSCSIILYSKIIQKYQVF